ncbi:SDR family oxidoreductase [Paraburkholderia graminis]|jgi:NAD(P)-dependent dehydrogenase (short-subunit alcohol dehydrogenase family)|uniref:NAD(P)-dependent dehydrogenase (Short-subunit alcohol dehydrogenase family) n=1 Tax=Paraburkholderia graminis TaxID=60548 RepID=A0ABD5CN39_9BURK|nr:SDR family oxidoreductase [Paraburkholderia graminis]AXF07991.1 SDR family oxidoreductase [Paraburkholderia graminis]MDQ0623131.1 NAD(P)-dependent dehydrogenase (short-subunit alcohol dehydrogenase family) [Paraburkholderia graminis]MDR6206667.1 NAD(P)-dependent dehydrogenase (short-subunit alcohol dehydrogenase family) [Paraburkholderia graminis]MDR6466762.1 NAD(P)-dependent dehydrogenase (short-subunit alcohol dehydrogenase family) [Paraburkholderia graminis]MDR6473962.1 NAD(P)-dependent 
MFEFPARVAVITGAASGFGQAFAQRAAALRMKLVLADVNPEALAQTVDALRAAGADAIGVPTDVSNAAQVEALAQAALDAFGKVHLLFNNAGVGSGGFLWESSANDWAWVFGVNVMGVAHGVRAFAPLMLAQNEPAHIVNTASVAGLLSPPAMGVYNASKHAVVSLTETLYHDLQLAQAGRDANARVGCSLLCPAFAPTGIADAERMRPAGLRNENGPTRSQIAAGKQLQRAVRAGKLSAAEVAALTFDAIAARRFYIITHPAIMATVKLRHEDIEQLRDPTDPMSLKPEVRSASEI